MKNAMQLKAIMKKLAKENQISAQLVLQNYMLERFLERVSLSPYRDNYIIKGGFLISSMVGLNSRATMDMDATIKGYPVTQDAVQKMIEQILTVPVDDDITFTFKSIGEIREGDEYTGYRVALTADFPPMAVPLKLDITTGDKITPREIQYDYKLMLEDRHIYAECRENQGISHWAQLPHPQGKRNSLFAERNTRRLQHCQCDNRQCGVKGIYPLSYRCHLYR